MTSELQAVEATLIEQRQSAFEQFSRKMSEAEAAADVYNRMDAAWAAFTGKLRENAIGSLKPGRRKGRGATTRRKHATKEHVLPALTEVVEDNPGIDKEDAEELTKHKLKESGLGINGVSSQIRKYLVAEPFRIDESGHVFLIPK